MNNLVIGLSEEFCEKSFIINRIKKYLNYNIIGDYLTKLDYKYLYVFFNINNVYYNGESTKSKIKYKRPFTILRNSISYKKGNVLYYPYIAEFYLSFIDNLLRYRSELCLLADKNEEICMISSNKNKIEKNYEYLSALGNHKLYGKYGLETINSDEADAYNRIHDSAIKTHNKHLGSFIVENQFDLGYVTEKVLLCLYGNSVPIYLGTDISNIIKNEYFINFDHYVSLSENKRKSILNLKYQNIIKQKNFFSDDFNNYLNFIKNDFLIKNNFIDSKKITQLFRKKIVI